MAPMTKTPALFRRDRPLEPAECAYQIGATLLRALDALGLQHQDAGLVFSRITLHVNRYVAYEIETTALTDSLVKTLRKYRLVMMLTQTLGLPVKSITRQASVTFAVDLAATAPIGWRTRLKLFSRCRRARRGIVNAKTTNQGVNQCVQANQRR